jgi:hypothetical protein
LHIKKNKRILRLELKNKSIMKKLIMSLAVVAALGFTSCSSDDDKGGNDDGGCQTCDIEALGFEISTEICDNEDGTITVTTEGVEQIIDLEEGTYAQYISALEAAGYDCN